VGGRLHSSILAVGTIGKTLRDVAALKPTCAKHEEDGNSGLDEGANLWKMISPFDHVAKVVGAVPPARRIRAYRAA
jgi:hypothetical protein